MNRSPNIENYLYHLNLSIKMWWFFRKKGKKEDLDLINQSLKNSFNNVKTDLLTLRDWVENKEEYQDKTLQEISMKIENIENILGYLVNKSKEEPESGEEQINLKQIPQTKKLIEQLTDKQKSYFLQLALLIKESPEGLVPMKNLAENFYPTTEYKDVKSLISSYTDLLETFGLIEKRRKGRNVLLTITEKGKTLIPKNIDKIKKITIKNKID